MAALDDRRLRSRLWAPILLTLTLSLSLSRVEVTRLVKVIQPNVKCRIDPSRGESVHARNWLEPNT
jgi:hypothetical protein